MQDLKLNAQKREIIGKKVKNLRKEGLVPANIYGKKTQSIALTLNKDEFQQLYNEADLVISKGQGNLEGLIDAPRGDIYYLLMVKCEVIADRLGVAKGSFVCADNKSKKEKTG